MLGKEDSKGKREKRSAADCRIPRRARVDAPRLVVTIPAMSAPPVRSLPAVEKVLSALGPQGIPRQLVTTLVREQLEGLRSAGRGVESLEEFLGLIRPELARLERCRIRPVINATGVLLHTNLGRAPITREAAARALEAATNYNNLEFDLETGERGHRGAYVERLLAELVQAEAATVVNNCASALVLILRNFTAKTGRREVIISRGELIEIGGGFRVPEIMEASGAVLREVGTTNKTSLRDYAQAITPETAMLLKVHRSNFYMEGFVDGPSTEELAALAKERALPLVEDLGSGALVSTDELAEVEHEPTPHEILAKGVDLVCFSGDKILGGPQAGIIVGRAELIHSIKREPFFRALRCDKIILSILEQTVAGYLAAKAKGQSPALPLLDMLSCPKARLAERVKAIGESLAGLPIEWSLGEGISRFGGGTMPRSAIPSVTLDVLLPQGNPQRLAKALRLRPMPIIGYVDEGRFKLDLRTVFPEQDAEIMAALRDSLKEPNAAN